MQYFEFVRQTILEPRKFFSQLKKEKRIDKALILLVLYTLIYNLLDLVISFDYINDSLQLTPAYAIVSFIIIYVFANVINIGIVFLYMAISHIFLRWLNGRGSFVNTFNASLLSYLPLYILNIVFAVPSAIIRKSLQTGKSISVLLQSTFLSIAFVAFVLSTLALLIYCYYWSLIALSSAHKISKLRVFVATFIMPLAVFFLLALILAISVVIIIAISQRHSIFRFL